MNSINCTFYILIVGAIFVFGVHGQGQSRTPPKVKVPSRGQSRTPPKVKVPSRARTTAAPTTKAPVKRVTTQGWNPTTQPTWPSTGGGGGGGWQGGMGGGMGMGMGGFPNMGNMGGMHDMHGMSGINGMSGMNGMSGVNGMSGMNGMMNVNGVMVDPNSDHGMAPAGTMPGGGHTSQMMALQNMKMTMGDNFNFNPNPPNVAYTRCPRFTTLRMCTINPCPPRCKRWPQARCVTNPCGGCSAEWFMNGNRILDCD